MKEREKHLTEYFALLVVITGFVGLFWVFREVKALLILLSVFVCVLYVLWGILHHKGEGRLHKEIVAEYMLLSFFVFLLLLTAISF